MSRRPRVAQACPGCGAPIRWAVASREAALDRAAGSFDLCDCRVCRGLRGSPLTVSRLRSISPDGEW